MLRHLFRHLSMVVVVSGLIAGGSRAARAADPLAIGGVSLTAPADPQAAPKYGKVELLVALTGGSYTRAYEPRPSAGGLDLAATFTAPDASQRTVCGYFDGAAWRVRFAPTQVGDWTFAVSAQDASGTAAWTGGAFRCVASAAPGFARLDGRNLRFTEGAVLYAIGANNGWQYAVEQPAFATLAAQGINLLSFWLNSPWLTPADPEPRAPIENATQGPGVYNQAACAYLDGVVARAEAAGVYLLPTIWSHGNLRQTGTHGWGTGWWDKLAYSSVCSATDFFKTTSGASDTPQWAYQKNFYRYLLARWGYSRALVGWVTLCEIDGTTGYAGTSGANPAQASAWCGAVRDYLAANDPYRLAGGAYPAAVSKTDYSADAATWSNGCNLAAVDSYTQQRSNVGIAHAIATQTTAMRGTGRPAFHAEFGGQVIPGGATEPAHLHNGLWAGFAAGACLAPLKWCDGGDWPLLTDASVGPALQDQLSFQAQFAGGLDYLGAPGFTAATVTVTPTTARGWGMRLEDRGFAWLQNTAGTMGGQSVALATLAAGTYVVTWYDTWQSAAAQPFAPAEIAVAGDGVLRLTVPALARGDIAVRFARQPNQAPVAADQSVVLPPDTAQAIALTATDPDGEALTFSLVDLPAHGTVTGAPPSVTYTPATGFSGDDRFTFKANDGALDSNVAAVTLTVAGGNQPPALPSPPAATPNPAAVGERVAFAAFATDPEGQPLSYAWDFGDGAAGAGAEPQHAYLAAGTFTAMVTVSDGQQTATGRVAVDVRTPLTVAFQDGVLPAAAYTGATDVSLKSTAPKKNFGTANPLEVNGNAAVYALLRWDLTPGAIPPGSRVLAAEIAVNVTDATANAFAIYELRRAWTEHQATWQLAQTGTNWQVAGAQGANDRGTTVLGTATGATGARTWALNAAGVALVQHWVSTPANNNGVTIQGPATLNNRLRFNSGEATNTATRPKLTLRYLAPW